MKSYKMVDLQEQSWEPQLYGHNVFIISTYILVSGVSMDQLKELSISIHCKNAYVLT